MGFHGFLATVENFGGILNGSILDEHERGDLGLASGQCPDGIPDLTCRCRPRHFLDGFSPQAQHQPSLRRLPPGDRHGPVYGDSAYERVWAFVGADGRPSPVHDEKRILRQFFGHIPATREDDEQSDDPGVFPPIQLIKRPNRSDMHLTPSVDRLRCHVHTSSHAQLTRFGYTQILHRSHKDAVLFAHKARK
jgi:hypothetical protein